MKSKKVMVVFILMVAFLLVMVTCTKANDDVGQLPIIDTGNNPSGNAPVLPNNTVENNSQNAPVIRNTNNANNETLPQTGVAGDAVLFVFITVCIASAAYAYFRIKKYNELH